MAKAEPQIVRPIVDGREFEVRFGKSDRIIKLPYPVDAQSPSGVLFVGRSGRTFIARVSEYPTQVRDYMVFHGAKQKLGDEYADLDNEADCFEALIALDERLARGNWDAERKGYAGISVLMRALMEVFSLTEDAARTFLKPLSKIEKDALRASAELKPVIDRIEAERGKNVDVGSILARIK